MNDELPWLPSRIMVHARWDFKRVAYVIAFIDANNRDLLAGIDPVQGIEIDRAENTLDAIQQACQLWLEQHRGEYENCRARGRDEHSR